MKSLSRALALLALTGLFARDACSDEPLPGASIRVDIQMVSLSTADAIKLIPQLEDRITSGAGIGSNRCCQRCRA